MENKTLNIISLVGESGVTLSAFLWFIWPVFASWFITFSAFCFAIGRLVGKNGDYSKSMDFSHASVALRRLYRQRMGGILFLMISTVVIHIPIGFYSIGIYVYPTSWLIPFLIFTIFETYTAFRIPSEEKKLTKQY